MNPVTIKDIAKKLNVSVSTVSRALNDKYDIRKETRDLILATAEEMGYSPNPIAKSLLNKCSKLIGVVVPEFINSFFPKVIIGIQEVLHKEGYQLIIMQSNESSEIEQGNIKTLKNQMVDGIIVSLAADTIETKFHQALIDQGTPMVFFNRVANELKTSKVIFDDHKWAFFATEHLIYQRYKNIIHFAGPMGLLISNYRKKGFTDAMKKHKLTVQSNQIIETGLMMEDGERTMKMLIEKGQVPEAIFCVNDPTAIGAIKALKQNGYRIPHDVAVVGFSESRLAQLIDPTLTSVEQPTIEMGRMAAQLILEQIRAKGSYTPQTIVLNGKLNIRQSSQKEAAPSQEPMANQ